jgi:hypothetical protein
MGVIMKLYKFLIILLGWCTILEADNQTATVSTVYTDSSLPFRVRLEKADFKLPVGLQSYIHGVDHNKWLLINGRVGGLHGFVEGSTNNFAIQEQNTSIFVIDPIHQKTFSRSLLDPQSGLTQNQIDLLSVTAAQGYQSEDTLYITGGYGLNSATGKPDTKNALTAINIPGLIHWVVNPYPGETAGEHIRQIFDDTFKVTGGYMNQTGDNPTLLIMGHEFNGFYADPTQNPPVFQHYTQQVRRFFINDDGVNLSFTLDSSLPAVPDPNYRRRDLNVVPVVSKKHKHLQNSFVALSGVFTLTTGVWTVPVEISGNGISSMADPSLPSTFKQGMNNYDCASFGMFSEKNQQMYTILLGGMSFGFFETTSEGLTFNTDDEIPFISHSTAIQIDKFGNYTQHLLKGGEFPLITSKTVNAGKPLLFGSEAEVILLNKVHKYSNEVLKLDCIKKPTVIGYVIGGIASTLPNTNTQADSFPSDLLFKVIVEPVHCHRFW